MTLKLGWFTAGRGPGSLGMFERALSAIDDGSLDASIEFVFMHRERGEGEGSDGFIDLAASRGIPVANLSSQRFRREHGGDFASHRAEYDTRVVELLRPYHPDVCVLAGYLLILSPVLNAESEYVNLHPALPSGPVGLWQKVIWDLIDQRADETGNMTFIVTDELDRGPQLTYDRVSIKGGHFDGLWAGIGDGSSDALKAAEGEEHPLFQAIRAEGVKREPVLLLETLKAIAEGSLSVAEPPAQPLDLTAQVEAASQGS
ncbi:MAG: formyltransferase family protein [Chloroflexi bacterium]|nr:formyltransferase family protein [Chloroflexota bacterium]